MAATLAIHVKGLGQIDYETLRKVSDHFMSIPSIALEKVLRVLEQVGFVRLVERGPKIQQVIPNIPVFDDVYEQIGSYATSECELNSHEQATLAILAELQDAPRNRDALRQLGHREAAVRSLLGHRAKERDLFRASSVPSRK